MSGSLITTLVISVNALGAFAGGVMFLAMGQQLGGIALIITGLVMQMLALARLRRTKLKDGGNA